MLQEEPDALAKKHHVSSSSSVLLVYILGRIFTQKEIRISTDPVAYEQQGQEKARLTING